MEQFSSRCKKTKIILQRDFAAAFNNGNEFKRVNKKRDRFNLILLYCYVFSRSLSKFKFRQKVLNVNVFFMDRNEPTYPRLL